MPIRIFEKEQSLLLMARGVTVNTTRESDHFPQLKDAVHSAGGSAGHYGGPASCSMVLQRP